MTYAQIKSLFYYRTGTSASDISDANLDLLQQRATERVVSLINRADNKWEFDDTNYSDLPSATSTITSGQQQYSLATTHSTIDRIELKDSNGTWKKLKQIDRRKITRDLEAPIVLGETTPSTGREGAHLSGSGVPEEYDLIGGNIFLFPTPNYTQASSIRVYFTRAPLLFSFASGAFTDSTGSTGSSPGFNSLFHDLIPLWASYDFATTFGKNNAQALMVEILRKEQELVEFYGGRNRDERPRLSISSDSNK